MNLADESIYNLLPPAPVKAQRRGLNASAQHAAAVSVGPSYSTFPSRQTGDGAAATMFRGQHAAIGRPVGDTIDPKNFLKSHNGSGGGPAGERQMIVARSFVESSSNGHSQERGGGGGGGSQRRAHEGPKKPAVPAAKTERPVMNLHTDKNFVHANAVDAICTAPRKVHREAPRPTEAKDFGKVPAYIADRKAQIADEQHGVELYHEMRTQRAADQKAQFVRRMDEDERDHLSKGLRKVWADKYRNYQALPFARDTALQISRKENLERELKEIEASLEKLERPVLFVHRDDTIGIAQYAKMQATKESERTALQMVKQATTQQK